jgi:ribonuclease BN (tRNA processing enzyme)
MRITILGSSPACPNPGGASAGYLVESRVGRLLVDCGHGVVPFLQTVTDFDAITAIIISHMHPDHFFDLLPLAYGLQFSGAGPRPLYLPPGGRDILERLADAVGLPAGFWSNSYHLHQYDPAQRMEVAGLHIEFAPTQHFVPANAMRFIDQADGATAGYTADTAASDLVVDLLRGTSLAIIESTLAGDVRGSSTSGHLTASQAGEMARRAGACAVVLTHYWDAIAERLHAEASRTFGQPVEMARQGMVFEL